MGEVQLRIERLGDFDPSCKSSRQLRDELRDATRSIFRREKGDLFNFKSVRLAEEEMVVLDLPGIQKAGARGNKSEPSADNSQDETEADRKALLKLAKKLVKAKQPRESEPSSDSDEDEPQADKASCSASSSLKNVKPQMDANGGRHAVSQQDLRHQRRIITPQALQQWWLERVQLSGTSDTPPKGPTGLAGTSFKQPSRGPRQQLQPDIQRVEALKKSVTMTFDASPNSSSHDPEANGSMQSEKQRFDPRMKRIVSGGRLKHGPEPSGASGRMGDIFEERYSSLRRPQHSPGSALEANIHALGKTGLGGTFEVQGRTFEVASRASNSPQGQKFSMLMTGRNGAQPTGPSDCRSAPTSRESIAGGPKVMNDSMDARQSPLQLPPVPGARPSGSAAMQLPQCDGTSTYDYSVSGQTNSPMAIQSMHQMQREYSRKKPLLHKTRPGGPGQRPLMMQGAM